MLQEQKPLNKLLFKLVEKHQAQYAMSPGIPRLIALLNNMIWIVDQAIASRAHTVFVAVGLQEIHEFSYFFQNPQSFFEKGSMKFFESFAHPASDMELTDLMFQLQLLCYHLVTEQIIAYDHANAISLYKWC